MQSGPESALKHFWEFKTKINVRDADVWSLVTWYWKIYVHDFQRSGMELKCRIKVFNVVVGNDNIENCVPKWLEHRKIFPKKLVTSILFPRKSADIENCSQKHRQHRFFSGEIPCNQNIFLICDLKKTSSLWWKRILENTRKHFQPEMTQWVFSPSAFVGVIATGSLAIQHGAALKAQEHWSMHHASHSAEPLEMGQKGGLTAIRNLRVVHPSRTDCLLTQPNSLQPAGICARTSKELLQLASSTHPLSLQYGCWVPSGVVLGQAAKTLTIILAGNIIQAETERLRVVSRVVPQ